MNRKDVAELLNRRRRQILVHSIIYYKMDDNLISDSAWSAWATELEELQKKYPDIAAKVPYEGGLFEHSLNVTNSLVELTKQNSLAWGRPESPYIIGMFHDICKQDQYRHPVDATFYGGGAPIPLVDESKWEYDPDAVLKGHGEKSVMLLSQHLSLTMEEILCIRYHMGAFVDQKEWNDYTRAIHAYPNVLWTHTADMLAAHILEVDK